QEEELKQIDQKLETALPELQAMYHNGSVRPVVRYYEGEEIATILSDVLETCTDNLEYRAYSTEGIREYLYKDFPTFSDVRIAKGIHVKVISLGKGGELRGLDERKWLEKTSGTPTYIIMYPGKTAYISLNAKKEAVGVVIHNPGVYETQKMIFDSLWQTL
ncbi:MAG TPA: TrmB family transcriptional regulator, partial [Candidatus Kapabacteria bacterium]|nr:TrmB family transcriptional regulator [Candidatus Kapabacteria bacterium]